jgi:SIR2-like domain
VARAQQSGKLWADCMSDDARLEELVRREPPEASVIAIAGIINGFYRGAQQIDLLKRRAPDLASQPASLINDYVEKIRPRIEKLLPHLQNSRRRLGWRQREVDIELMRWVRRSCTLSLVLGAGVSQGAGAPGWAELVKLLLQRALEHGHEISRMVPSKDNPPVQPFKSTPEGQIMLDMRAMGTTWRVEREVVRVERFTPEAKVKARAILGAIDKAMLEKRPYTDTECLMQGAQLCSDLYGQELFTHLTGILYRRAPNPSETHRAIASLADVQQVRGRGFVPTWESVITYNFDNLMGEAFTEYKIPHAAWAMTDQGVRGAPDKLAQRIDGKKLGEDKDSWYVPIYHLHGFTPREPFLITDMRFVFSTKQYLDIYGDRKDGLIDQVFDQYLANPVHIALYVGCSFADEYMNELLRQAAERYPGRWHYAILKWPKERNGRLPDPDEMNENSAKYLESGVQPIWVDDYSEEIPPIIRSLK